MTEEAKQVLQMVANGTVTVEEGERLLEALKAPTTPKADDEPQEKGTVRMPKYLRVVVDEGKQKVNVRVPVQLIRAGMKFTALIPDNAKGDVEKHLSEKGINLDFNKLKPEDVDEFIQSLSELQVDVDDGEKATVRVFCE